mgnify:CR=1 FL=1
MYSLYLPITGKIEADCETRAFKFLSRRQGVAACPNLLILRCRRYNSTRE